MMTRTFLFLLVLLLVCGLEAGWLSGRQPRAATALAIQQLNGGNGDAAKLRQFEAAKEFVHVIAGAVTLLAAWLCFGRYAAAAFNRIKARLAKTTTTVVGLLSLVGLTGCMKPYDKPEFVEIDTSETGFLTPLEGDATQQAKFQSEDYLRQRKVAAKRVQITHRWSQEGRLTWNGRWIPTVRLVKVNRSPVTREWISPQSPTAATQALRGAANDKAIWIESADSVGFSMGFTCTAFIAEDDAARFLYWYPSGSLADVMDREVRGRVQQSAAEVAAKYALDLLRGRKQEIADAVKNDLINFFAARGVTITTVGMFGGMTYENPEIQKAIDQTFIAQQLKVVAEAKFQAPKKENDRIQLEADGAAEKARREAMGLADARKTAAAAEASAIREVNRALSETQPNPALYQLKALDVEKARVEKWDGRYPTYFLGSGGGGPNLLWRVPSPDETSASR